MNTAFRVGGDVYDNFMGRYSRVLAPLFADFVGVTRGMRALDVGAGTGALTAELLARGAAVVVEEPSPEFVTALRERFPGVEVHDTPAEALPFAAGEFDAALAQRLFRPSEKIQRHEVDQFDQGIVLFLTRSHHLGQRLEEAERTDSHSHPTAAELGAPRE